jgi:hypothetical protein
MVSEVLVAVFAVIGNAFVILVFYRERRLRRRTNYYIVSLAIADLLVGLLGIPFAILASLGLPTNLHACLFTVSLLVVLCTISIFCLVAVSVDRYWAILYPMGYSRNVRTKTAIGECLYYPRRKTWNNRLLYLHLHIPFLISFLPPDLHLGTLNDLFPRCFPFKILYAFLISHMRATECRG